MESKVKGVIFGGFAIMIVIALNAIVLSLLNYPPMAIELIEQYWLLLVILIGGFGLQVGLFTYFHSQNAISCSATIASGDISAFSMILCCTHYILNILPFLGAVVGISALSVLSGYTLEFIILGVVSNVIGIVVMFYQQNKYSTKRRHE